MDYNTQRPPLIESEYGRLVQDLVAQAAREPDRTKRQAMSSRIVQLMRKLSAKDGKTAADTTKLWNHLALMSGYKLDIDYPCAIERLDRQKRGVRLPYPVGRMRYRHYGHMMEDWLSNIQAMPESPEKEAVLHLAGARMKRYLVEWKGDGIDDRKVAHDISTYSDGALQLDIKKQPLPAFRTRRQTTGLGKKK